MNLIYIFGTTTFDFSLRPYIMGIVNVTPDSFSDGNMYLQPSAAVARAFQLIDDGADIIDIGGESTRPGSESVSVEEELRRVIPIIEKIRAGSNIPISIDTTKSEVARQALATGADIVNDISALKFDEKMMSTVAQTNAAVVLMHIKGTPKTMQSDPGYDNIVAEISSFLQKRIDACKNAGIEKIIIDPGIGFGKTLEHNLEIFRRLDEFQKLGFPVLVGPSRKSFIGALTGLSVDERLEGTAAAVAVSVMRGANILRVHDVKEMKRVATVAAALR
jgi:dihydropteroate synthase